MEIRDSVTFPSIIIIINLMGDWYKIIYFIFGSII